MARTTFSGPVKSITDGGDLTRNPIQTAIASLTDNTTGTADGTLVDVGATYNQATLNNNFADLAAKVNAILTVLRNANIIST